MTRIAYLAQPIDQADRNTWMRETAKINAELTRIGYVVYQPARAWCTPAVVQSDPRLQVVNELALLGSDLMVACLPAGVPSIGVPMEISQALDRGLPVIVVTTVESFALDRDGVIVVPDHTGLEQAVLKHEAEHAHYRPTPTHSSRLDPIRLVIRDGHQVPARTYADDAGLDLTTASAHTIRSGEFIDVHTQVDQVQLPDGYWGLITGRSSTLRKHGLHVPVAVIDPGWRGPLFIGVWNLSEETVNIFPGDRLGQLILLPNCPAPVMAVDQVSNAERGLAGFGSSGQ